jgi:AAA15 family ATPase/GTPase
MKITSVSIENYRSIRSATIDLKIPLRLLFGMNEAGKSNVLRALAHLDPKRPWEPSDIRVLTGDDQPSDGEIVWDFEFSEDDIANILSLIAKHAIAKERDTAVVNDNTKYTIESYVRSLQPTAWVTSRTPLQYSIYERPEQESDAGKWAKLTPGSANINFTVGDDVFTVTDATLIHVSLIPAGDTRFEMAPIRQFMDKIESIVEVYIKNNLPSCILWAYRTEFLLPAKLDIAQFAAEPSKCIPLRHMFALAGHNDPALALRNAAQTPIGTKQLLDRIARIATEHLHRIWPEHAKIRLELQKDGSNIVAAVKDHENSYEFAQRSDGFKRFVAFLLTVSTQVRNGALTNALILVDEPDTSLHPSGTRLLRKELAVLAKNNVVVGTSHSIFMVDADRIDEHMVVKKLNEITTISEVDKSSVIDEEVIYNAMGASIFEFIKQSNIIFEGWRDKALFRVGLKKLKPKSTTYKRLSELGYTHAQGVKDVPKIASMLELAQRKFIVISDADQPAKQHKAGWTYAAPWYCYEDIATTFKGFAAEDFFTTKRIVEVTRAWSTMRGSSLSAYVPDPSGCAKDGILRWLMPLGWERAKVHEAFNEIKESLFKDLQPEHIDNSYVDMLEALSAKLSS